MAKNCIVIAREPLAKRGDRNSRGSSSGFSTRSDQATKPARRTQPPITVPRKVRLVQPWFGASMTP